LIEVKEKIKWERRSVAGNAMTGIICPKCKKPNLIIDSQGEFYCLTVGVRGNMPMRCAYEGELYRELLRLVWGNRVEIQEVFNAME
jgi:hypothetical protein